MKEPNEHWPKLVTEAYLTSDGRYFHDREEAEAHENRKVVLSQVKAALNDLSFDDYGRSPSYRHLLHCGYKWDDFADALLKRLVASGVVMKLRLTE